jgi:hypothetical protein
MTKFRKEERKEGTGKLDIARKKSQKQDIQLNFNLK